VNLNENALRRCQQLVERATEFRVVVERGEGGARLIDCGADAPGGLQAGVALAEVCMAGMGRVELVPGNSAIWPGPAVAVTTDQPVAACMASQYAGWQIAGNKYFAMGSGPMRAARGKESLFDKIGYRERASHVIGVLETGKLPPAEVCVHVAEECGVEIEDLTMLIAPTASIAGTIQVVARTIETSLHKMHELGFDITRVTSGFGVAPLPPIAADDLAGIGRTNDAVLYGGEVTLWVRGEDAILPVIGTQIPSSSSADHGQPFGVLFERYGRDFYKIDPLLFSPAAVTLISLESGRSYRYGELRPDVLLKSFQG
jgi:methenyltetrahydromethanopterin cyclohydrolase